jgi:O-antigen/teichoic acid export membrane protein
VASGIRDTSWNLGARVTVILIGAANQSCLAWFLGPAARGSFALCVLFASLLSLTFTLSCGIALEYLVAARKLTLSEGVSCGLGFGAFGTLAGVLVGLGLLHLPLSFVTKAAPDSFYLSLVYIPLSFFQALLLQLFTAIGQFGRHAFFLAANAALQLVLTFLFLWVVDGGVNGALLAVILSGAATTVWTLLVLRRSFGLGWAVPSSAKLRQVLGFGFRYYPGNMSNQANLQLGSILLALFATREQIGLFAVAVRLGTQIMILPDALMAVLVPRIAGAPERRSDLVARCSRLVGIVCGAALLVLVVFADPIVRLLLSPAFLPVVPLLRILAVGVFLRSVSKVFIPYLLASDRGGTTSAAVIVGLLTNVGFLALLLPTWGLTGAAFAMSAGYSATAVVLMIAFERVSRLGFRRTWRFGWSDWTEVLHLVREVRKKAAFVNDAC